MVVLRSLAVIAALATAAPAAAHVSVQPKAATVGAYEVLRFGVGHGCDDKATTRLVVNIPTDAQSARPQPKPGWSLSIQHAPDDAKKVTSVTWTGRLAADQFDEFLIQVHLPKDGATAVFPAIQTCGKAQNAWNGADPQHPAPTVSLTPAPPPDGGHDHHH